jgi:hypothetical protein
VSLEALGIPVAVIVTSEFVREAGNQARVLGMPDLTPVVIDHPLSTLSWEQIGARADQALPQVTQAWTR